MDYALSNTTSIMNDTIDSMPQMDTELLMLIIDYTTYSFYTIIFLLGIIGNSVVIYVLLSPICCASRGSNRENYNYNAATVSNYNHNLISPVTMRRQTSLRARSAGNSLRPVKGTSYNDEALILDNRVVNFRYIFY